MQYREFYMQYREFYIQFWIFYIQFWIFYIQFWTILYIVLGYFIYSSKKIKYSSGPVLAAHRQRGPRTHLYIYMYIHIVLVSRYQKQQNKNKRTYKPTNIDIMVYSRYNELVFMGVTNQQTSHRYNYRFSNRYIFIISRS